LSQSSFYAFFKEHVKKLILFYPFYRAKEE
jgi:hypothetical protein